jgi:hypothetical protein
MAIFDEEVEEWAWSDIALWIVVALVLVVIVVYLKQRAPLWFSRKRDDTPSS